MLSNETLGKRELNAKAVISLKSLQENPEFVTVGETMMAFEVPSGTIIEFPYADAFAAWIREFRGNKIPYISGYQTSGDAKWLDIPASVFRNTPIKEDLEEFSRDNEFGMLLRSKDRDLDRWELLAGKRVKLIVSLHRSPGFDKETRSIILDPDQCKVKTFYKVELV